MAKRIRRKRYEVLTWDAERQSWTPQIGVRRGPYTLMGLRKALRKLRSMGYDTSKSGGVAVLISERLPRRAR